MGSQQILMIILGVIVVGIAVSIALLFFDQSAEQANKDALAQDCLKIASAAQAYYRKPFMLGGGSNSFDGITIRDCGMADIGGGEGQNLSGTYSIASASGNTVNILGVCASNASQTVTVSVDMSQTDPAQRLSVVFAGW